MPTTPTPPKPTRRIVTVEELAERYAQRRRDSAAKNPGQICAAGYPLEVDTHERDDIPCSHFPSKSKLRKMRRLQRL